jgi:hypothetical protein
VVVFFHSLCALRVARQRVPCAISFIVFKKPRQKDRLSAKGWVLCNAFPGLKARAFRQLEADVPARK